MEKQIKLTKSLYTKEAILYTINLYLEEFEYEIGENETEFILKINLENNENNIDLTFFKKELNFNNLRFEIANNNKELRKVIISKAL